MTGDPERRLGGNDRVRARRTPWRVYGAVLAAAALIAAAAWFALTPAAGPSLRMQTDTLSVATVTSGRFEDAIAARARIIPIETIFLDAIEGGRVEARHVEPGVMLEAGQPILQLSNTALQLEVIRSEAQVAEQLNNLRNTELAVRRTRLEFRRRLTDIRYEIQRLSRLLDRQERLVDSSALATARLDETRDEFNYNEALLALTLDEQTLDRQVREVQLEQLQASAVRLERNLTVAQSRLEELEVRAPRAGQLAFLDAEIGQLVRAGERLGQIDNVTGFKLSAQLDEFYLPRVDRGLQGVVSVSGAEHPVRLTRVFPNVTSGRFEVELEFVDEPPAAVTRGQSVPLTLSVSASEDDVVLLPAGPFFQDTAGAWVFVVDADGRSAVRTPVRLGRRTRDSIEVLDGLSPGDRVVVSSYGDFMDVDRLDLGPSETAGR